MNTENNMPSCSRTRKKSKILIVGPGPDKSKGGIASVIQEIRNNTELNERFDIDIYNSYMDGNQLQILLYSTFAFLRFIFTKNNYDIYHIHAAAKGSTFRKKMYAKVAKSWGKKIIIHIHGSQYKEFYGTLSPTGKKHVSDFLSSADLVLALSSSWKSWLDSAFSLSNCRILENGIDISRFACASTSPEDFQTSFLFLGRLGKRKGTADLILAVKEAVKVVPELDCYIAGDGSVEKYQDMVYEMHLEHNIHITGWVDFSGKINLLKKVSTLILPSYQEGLPMAILEAMSCGKAIISTTVGAIPEVVTKENGILITPGDIAALTSAILKCCQDTAWMRRISSANMQKSRQQFSVEKMCGQLSEYYQSLEP